MTDLNLNIKYLQFVGIWPATGAAKSSKYFLFRAIFFIGLASQTLMLCSEIIDIIVNTNDLEQVTDGIFSAVMTFQGLFKQVYVSQNIRAFQELVTSAESVFYETNGPLRGEDEATLKSSRAHTTAITVSVSSVCLTASLLYPFIPLTASVHTRDSATNSSAGRLLPYSVWLPVDTNQTPYHEMLYGITSINAISVALYISSTDTFIISLIIHIFNQFDILQSILEGLTAESPNRHRTAANMQDDNPALLAVQPDQSCGDKQDPNPERHRGRISSGPDVTERLRETIQRHQRLLT
jgi:hypothetical protein